MSRIESAKNLKETANYSPKKGNFASRQSFQSGVKLNPQIARDISHEIVKPVEDVIYKKMPFANWISRMLAKHDGELQNQVINAAFTTTLAPAMIAWNPFSKQDDKTKQYTALRQPISAAIAILGGFPITSMINSYINKIGSEGCHESIDLRNQPNAGYLKAMYKKAKGMIDGQKVNLAEYISTIQKQREDLFTSLILEHPNHIKIDENTSIISVLKQDATTGTSTWVKMGQDIPNLTKQAELDKYLKSNNLHRIKFSDFMRDEFKFEFFEDGIIKPYTISDKLQSVKAMDFLRKLGVIKKGEFDEHELNKLLSIVRQRTTAEVEVKNALKAESFQAGGARKLVTSLSQHIARITQGYLGEQAVNREAITLGQFFERFNYNDATLQKLMNGSMLDALNTMKKHFVQAEKMEFNASDILQKFAKNIMHNKISKTASYFKNFKLFSGIFVNLFTTAVTCTALNWSYPRVVEKLFPHLVKDDDKSDKESKSLEQQIKKGGNK